jgi:hypothetical protein
MPARPLAFQRLLLVALAAVSLLSATAAAENARPRVLVFDTDAGPAPVGFVQALQIQLADRAALEPGPKVNGSLSERLDQASSALQAIGASVALWVERVSTGEDSTQFLVHVVSRQRDRVLVQVVTLPGPESPETDRALALKVTEVLASVLDAQAVDVAPAIVGRRQQVAPAAQEAAVQTESAGPRAGVVVEAGALGASAVNGDDDAQLGALAGAGARLESNALQAEAVARFGAASGMQAAGQGGTVETNEMLVGAALRLLMAGRHGSAGVHGGGGVRIVQARGQAQDGRTGEATRTVPFVVFGPEARANVGSSIALRAGLGMEVALRRQVFAVEGAPVAELGTVRGSAEMMLVIVIE